MTSVLKPGKKVNEDIVGPFIESMQAIYKKSDNDLSKTTQLSSKLFANDTNQSPIMPKY